MSQSNQSPTINEFVSLIEKQVGGVIEYKEWVERVNAMIPILLKEISVDSPIFIKQYKTTLLHLCAIYSDIYYGLLFQQDTGGKSINCNIADSHGFFPLHYACRSVYLLAVGLLLKHGAQVNAISSNGETPLTLLCSIPTNSERIETLKMLIVHGANVNYEFEGDRVVLTPAFRLVYSYYSVMSSFTFRQRKEGFVSFLTTLLDAGVDNHFVDQDGESILHFVCHNHDVDLAKLLIKYGYDYQLRNKKERLPQDGITAPNLKGEYLDFIGLLQCR